MWVEISDFNEDGHPDLAVVNHDSSSISILLGNGDGSFGARRSFAAGVGPWGASASDLNTDGHIDLAVASGAPAVSILLGNGDGSFQPSYDAPLPSETVSVVAGDLNRDGKPDLVFGTAYSSIYVVLGNGDGSFGTAASPFTRNKPISVLLADLNGDGILDAASADYGYVAHGWGASVLFGNGDGTFASAINFGYEVGIYPWPVSISAGDLNGDGYVDLAVVSETSGRVTALINNGDQTFRVSGQGLASEAAFHSTLGEFDPDGWLDIAVPMRGDYDGVLVARGIGDGTFVLPDTFQTGPVPYSAAAADLNRDARPDIVTANLTAATVSVLINTTPAVGSDTGPQAELLRLLPAFPNPAREVVTFRFVTPREGAATLQLFDAAGRLVKTLVNEDLPAGHHSTVWDLRTRTGAPAAPGIYHGELAMDGKRLTRSFVVLP